MQDNTWQKTDKLWQDFEKTGSINSYLIYKGINPDDKTNTSTNTNQQGR